jgi:hypothetical protein
MAEELDIVQGKEEFADVLAELSALSRDMLLAFRLQVGHVILGRFFGGDSRAYRSQNPNKEASFNHFVRTCQDDLTDLGLAGPVVRQCVLVRIAWDGLPREVREQLRFSHVVALAGVADPTARARLAMDTTLEHWSVGQLKAAIDRHQAGEYYDTDSTKPGTQPPPEKPEVVRQPQAGRMVTQLERAGQELQGWRETWSTIDPAKVRGPQRQRCLAALAAVKAEVATLEGILGGG